ncbi:MAG TPA: phosphoribosylformylglycinamidine synthase subunit PurS [bacterium]|nr:phosphoribosylformylglycinamidine synthase subunit PurS [bacterium]HOL35173.1 phosphoribosylformylglycinamidine synthase subunit PurS [bacterium]HPP09045.1 phosphoribosylformylglycinamidine synthase subunit PurS [bacterium]
MTIKSENIYIVEIGLKKGLFDAFGNEVKHSIEELGINGIDSVDVYDVYMVYGDVNFSLVRRIAKELLLDPVAQTMKVYRADKNQKSSNISVEVWYKKGVTDPVAMTAIKGIRDLGIKNDIKINCGKKYEFHTSMIDRTLIELICTKVLANTLIQDYIIKGI